MPCPIKLLGHFTSLSLVNDTSSDYVEVMQKQAVAGATLIWGNKTIKTPESQHFTEVLKLCILICLFYSWF